MQLAIDEDHWCRGQMRALEIKAGEEHGSDDSHNEVTFSRYTRPPWADNFRRVTTTLRRALGHRI